MWFEEVAKIKGIKPNEEIKMSYWIADQIKYVVTSDVYHIYYLYSVDGYKATKTKHKSNNPLDFDEFME